MGEEQFRKKVTWITFLFGILVVWVHSYNGELFLGKTVQGLAVDRFERFLGDQIGQIAVPGFFLLSAYLFYRTFDWNRILYKWRSRLYSILVPYVLWTLLYYAGYVVGSRLPFISKVVGKGTIPLNLSELAEAVLHYKYLYAFWYLQQLICLIVLAPVFYAVLRRFGSGLLFLAAVSWAVWAQADLPLLNEDALFYYGSGGFLALHGKRLERAWTRERCILGICLIGLAFFGFRLAGRYYLPGMAVAGRLLAPLGLWLAVDERRLGPVRPWMGSSLFFYASHFSFVRLVNKTTALLVPPSPIVPVALYLLMPVLMVAINYGLSLGAKRYAPAVWRALSGGR